MERSDNLRKMSLVHFLLGCRSALFIFMPIISIITSTFNRKRELKRAIKSVLRQSFIDFELLVVDDASDYSVKSVCKSFKDDRIHYFRMKENCGHDGCPKNRGILEAKGDYICFLDDDDEYRKDALKIMLTYAKETDADVVYCDYLIHQDSKRAPGWSVDFNVQMLQKLNYITMCSALIKRSAITDIGGFDENIPKFKDWNLWLRLQKNGAIFVHVPIITTEVHHLKDSISSKVKHEIDENGQYLPTYFDPVDCKIWPDKTLLGERKSLRIAVYTLAYNRLEYLKQMARLLDLTAGYHFDWYIIDDGSTDGTQEWIKRLTRDKGAKWRKELHYRLHEKNCGLTKSWNDAIDWLKKDNLYDIFVKVDDDAIMLTDDWLAAMSGIYERNRKVCLSPYIEGLENSPGGVLRQRPSGEMPYVRLADYILGVTPHLGGIVYSTPAKLWEEFRFDEQAAPGNRDVLLSQHAQRNGLLLAYLEEFRCSHGPHGTLQQKKDYPNRINTP